MPTSEKKKHFVILCRNLTPFFPSSAKHTAIFVSPRPLIPIS